MSCQVILVSLCNVSSLFAFVFVCLFFLKQKKLKKLSTSTKACAKFSLYCGEGKVVLPSFDKLPELLGHLLTATDSRGKDFRNHSSLAFCSLGGNIDKELANANVRGGVYTFRIQGVVHYYIGSLIPN